MSGQNGDDEARVHAMIAAACLGSATDAELSHGMRAYLERAGVAAGDVEAMMAGPARLPLYRRLIRNNLTGVVGKMLPRARARLNALDESPGAFDADFDRFLRERGPRTPYLRDVPGEFLAWVAPRWTAARASVPRWALDLARHELVEYEVAAAPDAPAPTSLAEVALDRPLALAEPLRLMRYSFAVHELPDDVDDRAPPVPRPVMLLVHRDPEHAVRFLELSPFAAAILERVARGDTLGDAVRGACAEVETPVSDAAVAEASRFLADLASRGIVLGGRET